LALVIWFGFACLFNRNVLIANPSLPYVGLLLLLTACVPGGEGAGLHLRRDDWRFPVTAYRAAWVLLLVGYTYSGIVKLAAPSWVDGSAMRHLLENPLARPTFLRETLLGLPPAVLQLATWGGLALEILAAPLGLVRRLRPWVWLALIGMQLGILSLVSFADLTLGMLCAHLFVFDPRWLRPRASLAGRHLVLYDGVCGLCDRSVQLLLEEDRSQVLTFAANQGVTRSEIERRRELPPADATLVLLRDYGTPEERLFARSSAPLEIARLVGGWFGALALLGTAVPRALRDRVYDFVAKRRFRWFGRLDTCRIPSPATRARFLA
jgi:predicted DCC family thiol-disulfide oxidoreductase YuxK